MRPDDIPDRLPSHPDEARLQRGETTLANSIAWVSGKAVAALRRHDREAASVYLTQLAQVAAAGQKAEVQAIRDQMDLLRD